MSKCDVAKRVRTLSEGNERLWEVWKALKQFHQVRYEESIWWAMLLKMELKWWLNVLTVGSMEDAGWKQWDWSRNAGWSLVPIVRISAMRNKKVKWKLSANNITVGHCHGWQVLRWEELNWPNNMVEERWKEEKRKGCWDGGMCSGSLWSLNPNSWSCWEPGSVLKSLRGKWGVWKVKLSCRSSGTRCFSGWVCSSICCNMLVGACCSGFACHG